MKAALFSPIRYNGPAGAPGWPVSAEAYSSDIAQRCMQASMAQFKRADEVGFDWVTVAEHHYSPFSLSPNPMVTAVALEGSRITQAGVVADSDTAEIGLAFAIAHPQMTQSLAMLSPSAFKSLADGNAANMKRLRWRCSALATWRGRQMRQRPCAALFRIAGWCMFMTPVGRWMTSVLKRSWRHCRISQSGVKDIW